MSISEILPYDKRFDVWSTGHKPFVSSKLVVVRSINLILACSPAVKKRKRKWIESSFPCAPVWQLSASSCQRVSVQSTFCPLRPVSRPPPKSSMSTSWYFNTVIRPRVLPECRCSWWCYLSPHPTLPLPHYNVAISAIVIENLHINYSHIVSFYHVEAQRNHFNPLLHRKFTFHRVGEDEVRARIISF